MDGCCGDDFGCDGPRGYVLWCVDLYADVLYLDHEHDRLLDGHDHDSDGQFSYVAHHEEELNCSSPNVDSLQSAGSGNLGVYCQDCGGVGDDADDLWYGDLYGNADGLVFHNLYGESDDASGYCVDGVYKENESDAQKLETLSVTSCA